MHELREYLLDILVQVEAAIDFPEEEIEFLQHPELIRKIDSLRSKIGEIIATYDWGRIFGTAPACVSVDGPTSANPACSMRSWANNG